MVASPVRRSLAAACLTAAGVLVLACAPRRTGLPPQRPVEAPTPLPELPPAPAPELGEVEAFIAAQEQWCPGGYDTLPLRSCERWLDWHTWPDDDPAKELRRGLELATLLRTGTPVQRVGATSNLLANRCLLTGTCQRGGNVLFAPRSICRDREIAMMLFESVEREVLTAEEIGPRRLISRLLEEVMPCLDLDALGLVDRFAAIAVRHDALPSQGRGWPGHTVRIRVAAARPRSRALWDLAFAEIREAPEQVGFQHVLRLSKTTLPKDLSAEICPRWAREIAAADNGVAELYGQFATNHREACFDHRELWLVTLEEGAKRRPLPKYRRALGSLGALCDNPEVSAKEVGRAARVARVFAEATPAETTGEARALALWALCRCDGRMAKPLVARVSSSDDDQVRLVAQSEPCQAALREPLPAAGSPRLARGITRRAARPSACSCASARAPGGSRDRSSCPRPIRSSRVPATRCRSRAPSS